jgi:hypothetical protein
VNFHPYPEDLNYYRSAALDCLKKDRLGGDNFDVTFTSSKDPSWQAKATQAFHFLRANANRRYSSQALMAVLTAAERQYREDDPSAWVITVEAPYNYDPDTEVKSGGLVGVMVQLNDGSCRVLMAVAAPARRCGVGTALTVAHSVLGGWTAWVKTSNRDAQQFLLARGLQPMHINSQGAVRYGNISWEEAEV